MLKSSWTTTRLLVGSMGTRYVLNGEERKHNQDILWKTASQLADLTGVAGPVVVRYRPMFSGAEFHTLPEGELLEIDEIEILVKPRIDIPPISAISDNPLVMLPATMYQRPNDSVEEY